MADRPIDQTAQDRLRSRAPACHHTSGSRSGCPCRPGGRFHSGAVSRPRFVSSGCSGRRKAHTAYLLTAVGGESPDPRLVRRAATGGSGRCQCRPADARRVRQGSSGAERARAWTGVREMPTNRGAPVGSTPMRTELTALGAARLHDEESCARYAGIGCISMQSGRPKRKSRLNRHPSVRRTGSFMKGSVPSLITTIAILLSTPRSSHA